MVPTNNDPRSDHNVTPLPCSTAGELLSRSLAIQELEARIERAQGPGALRRRGAGFLTPFGAPGGRNFEVSLRPAKRMTRWE